MRFSKEKDVGSSGSQSYLISSVHSRHFSVYRTLQCVPIREKNILEGGSWSQKWMTFWLIVILTLTRIGYMFGGVGNNSYLHWQKENLGTQV